MIGDFFQWAFNAAQAGIGGWDAVHLAINVALGVFFLCSGLNKTFHGPRHAEFCATLTRCGIPCVPVMRYVVSINLIVAGLMLIFGVLVPVAAMSLIIICSVALCTDGFGRVQTLPEGVVVNRLDYVAWQLYLPEVWYVLALMVPLTQGAPALSIQKVLL